MQGGGSRGARPDRASLEQVEQVVREGVVDVVRDVHPAGEPTAEAPALRLQRHDSRDGTTVAIENDLVTLLHLAQQAGQVRLRLLDAHPDHAAHGRQGPVRSVDVSTRFPAQRLTVWTTTDHRATIVAMTTESLRTVRDHLSEIVDRVERQHERVVITRNGREAAVIVSPDDLAELEETLSVLSDAAALADIREADEAYERGDVVRGVDAVRRLRG